MMMLLLLLLLLPVNAGLLGRVRDLTSTAARCLIGKFRLSWFVHHPR